METFLYKAFFRYYFPLYFDSPPILPNSTWIFFLPKTHSLIPDKLLSFWKLLIFVSPIIILNLILIFTMGANFAPSYANLAIGYWENNYIWRHNPFSANIIFFGRYIDNKIGIWDGTTDLITSFVDHCNHNPYGLSFTHVSDSISLAFLDLELGHVGDTIIAKNYTKPMAGNSFLHHKNCHYPK